MEDTLAKEVVKLRDDNKELKEKFRGFTEEN